MIRVQASPRRYVYLLATLVVMLLSRGRACLAEAPAAQGQPNQKPTILVELFTSQGCSNCPPAERLFSRLARAARPGVMVPLAWHVDYWNHLGWHDPFSLKRCSERQEAYATVLGAGGQVYTPQLVIDGREECVGSDEDCIAAFIAAARAREPAATLTVTLTAVDQASRSVQLRVRATMRRSLPGAPPLQAFAALFESALQTQVTKGENAGQTLNNDFVVRRLEPLFTLASVEGSSSDGPVTLGYEPDWKLSNLGVAAFLQQPDSMEVFAAAAQPLLSAQSAPQTAPGGQPEARP